MPFDCRASFAASAPLMSMPAIFIRFITAVADVARTGLMTELISGGAPRPSSPWHPRQFIRYRSDPCKLTVSFAASPASSICQRADSAPGVADGGPRRPVLPILVSSNVRCRWLSQLSPATAVGPESPDPQFPLSTVSPRDEDSNAKLAVTKNATAQMTVARNGLRFRMSVASKFQLEPGTGNVCHTRVLFLSISCTRVRVTKSVPSFMEMHTSGSWRIRVEFIACTAAAPAVEQHDCMSWTTGQ